jgi:hypothetical protein
MRKCQKRPRISAKETYILGKETYYCISIPEVACELAVRLGGAFGLFVGCWFRVYLLFRVQGSGFRVSGVGFRV